MAKSAAIVALHGMGSFTPDPEDAAAGLIYSGNLKERVAARYGNTKFEQNIVWKETYYGDIFDANQKQFIRRVEKGFPVGQIRKFVIENLGDPGALGADPQDSNNKVYMPLRQRVAKAFADVEARLETDAPVIVICHSFGGHILSSYIWDAQKSSADPAEFPMAKRIACLVTFGCNIPIFTFAYAAKDIRAIGFPGTDLAAKHKLTKWWRNYFDTDDPLGFPLAPTGKGYADLASTGKLEDNKINAGGLFTSWNPFSHTAYWRDADIADAIFDVIGDLGL
jgi:hypothetical protein